MVDGHLVIVCPEVRRAGRAMDRDDAFNKMLQLFLEKAKKWRGQIAGAVTLSLALTFTGKIDQAKLRKGQR